MPPLVGNCSDYFKAFSRVKGQAREAPLDLAPSSISQLLCGPKLR